MNRLTERNDEGHVFVVGLPPFHLPPAANNILQKVINRLAAYEDTGLEPEEVADLAKAKADGRLVALPCKVGDTVYIVQGKRVTNCSVDEAYICDDKSVEYLVGFNCTILEDDGCSDCPFCSWSQDYSGEYSCAGEFGEATISSKYFGKTVFLSREEAEAALKGAGKRITGNFKKT